MLNSSFFKEKLLIAIVEAIGQQHAKTLKQLQDRIYKHPVTGLLNRTYLEEKEKELLRKYSSLLIIDIRHLKKFNEIFGYKAIDGLLKSLAGKLKTFCKTKSKEKCLLGFLDLGRFWILTSFDNEKEVKTIAKELISLITQEPLIAWTGNVGIRLLISVNIGISLKENVKNIYDWIIKAELAAESSKEKGFNQIAFFEESFKETIEEAIKIEQLLKESLSNKSLKEEIYPVFQIKVNPITEEPVGVEVLMQWTKFSNIEKVIQVAETSDLIKELTFILWKKTAPILGEILDVKPNLSFGFNLSTILFKYWREIQEKLKLFSTYSIPFNQIELEITESSLITDPKTKLYINSLRRKGFVIVIDDFGKGFSSFDRLLEIDFQKVKFDKSLFDQLSNALSNEDEKKIKKVKHFIEGLIDFAKNQGYKTVAEGVEDFEIVQLLKEWGVDEIQGFYYSETVSKEKLIECLKNWDSLKKCKK